MELFALHLVHRNPLDDPCVVYQDVDLPDFAVDPLDEGLDVVFLGDIADVAGDVLDSGLGIVAQAALQGGFIDVVEDDVVNAGCNESLCDVEADSIGSTGNPGVLPFK